MSEPVGQNLRSFGIMGSFGNFPCKPRRHEEHKDAERLRFVKSRALDFRFSTPSALGFPGWVRLEISIIAVSSVFLGVARLILRLGVRWLRLVNFGPHRGGRLNLPLFGII